MRSKLPSKMSDLIISNGGCGFGHRLAPAPQQRHAALHAASDDILVGRSAGRGFEAPCEMEGTDGRLPREPVELNRSGDVRGDILVDPAQEAILERTNRSAFCARQPRI